MQRPWDRQGKLGDRGIKIDTLIRNHGVLPLHGANRRFQHRAASVPEGFAGFKIRLLADHAFAPNFLYFAVGIGNQPVAIQ